MTGIEKYVTAGRDNQELTDQIGAHIIDISDNFLGSNGCDRAMTILRGYEWIKIMES